MRIAYFDCFSGIAGDMVIGALLDLGLELNYLEEELGKLPVSGFSLSLAKARRGKLAGSNFSVQVSEKAHQHERYTEIKRVIAESELAQPVKEMSLGIFARLADAEAKIHGCSLDEVVFHEVGAIDSIVDVVGTAIGVHKLGVDAVYCSEMPLGQGTISCIHGNLPSPAPATLEVLKGVPVYSTGRRVELVTPTGAAIVASLARSFGPFPAMSIERVGYGAGDNDFADMPNLLRIILGQSGELYDRDGVLIMETNIDDMNPELYQGLMEALFSQGALDVSLSPLQMKKNRPGILLRVLCQEQDKDKLAATIFYESTALGLRFYRANRLKLKRKEVVLTTRFGDIRAKAAVDPGGRLRVSPEYEDCRQLAESLELGVREVYTEALKLAMDYQECQD